MVYAEPSASVEEHSQRRSSPKFIAHTLCCRRRKYSSLHWLAGARGPRISTTIPNPCKGAFSLKNWTTKGCENAYESLRIRLKSPNRWRKHRTIASSRRVSSRSFWQPHKIVKATTTTLLAAVATTRKPSRCIAVA